MRAVVLDGYPLNPGDLSWQPLEDLFSEFDIYDRTHKQDLITRIVDADVILTNKVPITQAVLEQCPQLKCILVTATGYNVVDVKAAQKSGVAVYNVPAYSTDEVAQHVMAMVLHVTNRVADINRDAKAGGWEGSPDFSYSPYAIKSLRGLKLGLVGYGAIAQRVAEMGSVFDMSILVYNRSEVQDSNVEQVNADRLCDESDFISIHIPETDETRGMFDRAWFNKMNKNTWLINTARGGLINERDLLQAVQSREIAGAFLDVLVEEPMRKGHPFIRNDKILLTPHVAWSADQARARCMETLVKNAKAFLNSENLNRIC